MKKKLEGKKVLILVENLYEDLELHYPRYRLLEEGAKVIVAGPKAKEIYQSKHSYPCQADIAFQEVKEEDFDAVIIPGGYAPDKMRKYPVVMEFIRQSHLRQKPIAFICHAGWVPASSKVMNGIKCTSCFSIKEDLINAGAVWVDAPVVVDKHFISSRNPDDLPDFCQAIIEAMNQMRN